MEKVNNLYIEEGMEIEYSIVGKGTPILVFHGGHSNCNEEFGYNELIERGYSIITPSIGGGNSTMWLNRSIINNPTYGRRTGERSVLISFYTVIEICSCFTQFFKRRKYY